MQPPPDTALAPPTLDGNTPPHNLEAEQSVLGAMLLSERSLYALVIEEGLRADDFYRERHRVIYAAMLELYGSNTPIDVLTVTEHLRQSGRLEEAGGGEAIDELTGGVPLVGNLRRYAQIVRENSLLRRLLSTTFQIQASVAERRYAPRDIVELAEKAMLEVARDDTHQDFRSIEDILHDELDKMQRLSAEGTALTGTPSGFKDLDEITGGFQPGNLVIVAARPSMGKCLTGSTLVYDCQGGGRRRIDEVVRAVEGGDDVVVAALANDLRLRPARVSGAFRNGRKPAFRLTTKLGRCVETTANHPLLTIRGWQSLGQLAAGDRIAVPRRLPLAAERTTMPDHEIVLLAALISDGSTVRKTPTFYVGHDAPLIDTVREACDQAGVGFNLGPRGTSATLSNGAGSRHNPATDLCRRHGLWGKRSEHKRVPDAVFRLDDTQIARFLSVLFGCDGYVDANERLRQIGYTTISEHLARDVQHLLLRFGIVSKIRILRRPVDDGTDKLAREVLITGQDDVALFARSVPVVGKLAPLARALAGLRDVRSTTNVDTVPAEAWSLILGAKGIRSCSDISVEAGHPRGHSWHVGHRGRSGPGVAQLADVRRSPVLRDLADSDVWWDEVASIESIGEQETYDLTVPGAHNFVADDVIVHNSALVTNIAENASIDHGRPVALFSLEMSEAELAQRFVASQGRIFGDKLRKGRVTDTEWPKILKATQRLSTAPLYVDDSSDIGILDIRAKARRLHQQAEGGLGLVIVDYLQLMRPDASTDNRVEQVGMMSRGLKILARELNVPVIALSQLSRAVEQRHDKKPILSDLRECVTGDTLVVLADGRRAPIEELVGTTPDVVALDTDGGLISARSDQVWPVGTRPVLRLRLASGRSLRATADHRILCGSGWQRLGALGAGDRVALGRRLPEPEEPDRWPDDHVVLLGQLIGDGSYLSGQPMRYTTSSEENSRAVTEAAMHGFGATVRRVAGRGSWHQLVISGNGNRWAPAGVNAWLRELGVFGQRSHEKRVPAAAFRLGSAQVALLLRHLWATDGSIWAGHRDDGRRVQRVAYSTSSPGLAADVAALLLRLGIVARIQVTGAMRHVVVSGAAAQRRFVDVVGAFGPRVAQAAALRTALTNVIATTNVDTLPVEIWADVRAAMAARGITQRAMARLRGTSYGGSSHFRFAPSRSTVAGYAALLGDDGLRAQTGDDLFWDTVVAVEPAGEEPVYDLTVPGPACWLADGIVSHNSGQIEQDADLVMFIYRDEYYAKEESEEPGVAQILIAKHRNGALGDVTLTFQKEYPKFMTYAGERYE